MRYKKENLIDMKLPELFEIRKKQLDENYKNVFYKYLEGIRFYIGFFIEVSRARLRIFLSELFIEPFKRIKYGIKKNDFDFNKIFERKGSEGVFRIVKRLGAKVDIRFENEDAKRQLEKAGNFILPNHQNELDTLMQSFYPLNHHWIVKSNLMKYPLFGKVLGKGEPILFYRGDKEKGQITKRAENIVEKLQKGENVAAFFEGTRSMTGEIGDNKRISEKYISKLMSAVEEIAKERDFKVKKIFVVLKTFDAFFDKKVDKEEIRNIPRKKLQEIKELLKGTRFKNNRIAFHVYGDRNIGYEYSDKEDETNIFGFFRKKLKDIVIEDIMTHK